MKYLGHLILFTCFLSVTNASTFSHLKDTFQELTKTNNKETQIVVNEEKKIGRQEQIQKDKERVQNKQRTQNRHDKILKNDLNENEKLNSNQYKNKEFALVPNSEGSLRYHKAGPILKYPQRRAGYAGRKSHETVSGSFSSTSMELKNSKEEIREIWLHKKFEALNDTFHMGDTVNVLAARPWGAPCGDPQQYDLPWGQCMMGMECEPEFHIPRGDYACGRTQFVCCAIKVDTYDMNQGFDLSLADKSTVFTDSEEKRSRGKTSLERRKRIDKRQKNKRKRTRNMRKRKIQKRLKRIIKDVAELLDKQFRNSTRERQRKTKQLKTFIRNMKQQFRQDRDRVAKQDDSYSLTNNAKLLSTLNMMLELNEKFITNSTFRDTIVNGTMPKSAIRTFLDENPQIEEFVKHEHDNDSTRRFESGSRVFLEDGKREIIEKLKQTQNNRSKLMSDKEKWKVSNKVNIIEDVVGDKTWKTNNKSSVKKPWRRHIIYQNVIKPKTDSSSSSSVEGLRNWKEEVHEKFLHSKFLALNESKPPQNDFEGGPWGTFCGDPNQQDVAWGQCLPATECDTEFRVYRGDYICGRTLFVCCAIKRDMEDMNQPIDDISILDTESSFSNEGQRDEEDRKRRRDKRDKKKRLKIRNARKKKFRKLIRKLTKEITTILDRFSWNSTRVQQRDIKNLKKKVKELKDKFKHDRESVIQGTFHNKAEEEALTTLLKQMKDMNYNYMENQTFRDILINGTASENAFRLLIRTYPELYYEKTRRVMRHRGSSEKKSTPRKYDVEYGYLYY